MKKTMGVLAGCALLGAMLLPVSSAHAANVSVTSGGAVGGCEVTLSVWPTSAGAGASCNVGSTALPNNWPTDGVAVGGFLPNGPLCLPTCTFSAYISSYVDYFCPPIGGLSPPPLQGSANGTLTVTGTTPPVVGTQNSVTAGFQWVRVGLVAVLLFDTRPGPLPAEGAGVAAFVPMPTLPTCAAPGPLTAHVVGLALVEQGI